MTGSKLTALSAMALTAAIAVGCSHDSDHDSGGGMSTGMHAGDKPLEGNPGATTNQAVGYPQSDTGSYHPLTDDTRTRGGSNQYHPAAPGSVQPGGQP